jgi:hypothetical protein
MNLVAPSPSRTIIWASSTQTSITSARSAWACRAAASASPSSRRGDRQRPLAVAISTNASLVDVSPSTVMRLKTRVGGLAHPAVEQRLRHVRVGRDEAQHRAHVRADHARRPCRCR